VLSALLAFEASTYVKAAFAVAVLCGVTGSASGGLQITLSNQVLVDTWLADSTINLSALHRILSVTSCSLDSLPHCGGVLATLDICRETHARAYKQFFVVTVIIPLIASVVIVGLALMGITF